MPTSVSEAKIFASAERLYRIVVSAGSPSPTLLPVADSVSHPPSAGQLSVTEGDSTPWSGAVTAKGYSTSTCTDPEQLFVVLDSPDTESTHAP